MKEYVISIALKSGNYANYAVQEEQLEKHTRDLMDLMRRVKAGNCTEFWAISSKPNWEGHIQLVVLGENIAGFGVAVKDSGCDHSEAQGFSKEFMATQLEVLKLQREIFRKQLKDDDWKTPDAI